MCSEHQFNRKFVEQGLHLLRINTLFFQKDNCIKNRFAKRFGRENPFSQLLHAVMFLSKIDELKVGGERGRDAARLLNIERFHLRFKLFRRFDIPTSSIFRCNADAFLNREKFRRLEFADHVPKNISQDMDRLRKFHLYNLSDSRL